MSSILKALRKIEEEKRVAEHAVPDLRADQGRVPAKSRQILPLLTGTVLGAVLVGGLFLWSPGSNMSVAKHQPVATSGGIVSNGKQAAPVSDVTHGEVVVDPAVPVVSPQTTKRIEQNLEPLAESNKKSVLTLSPEPLADAMPSASVAETSVNLEKKFKAGDPVRHPSLTTQTASVADVETASIVSSELPESFSLSVTEIFFQEESDNSMAVVNDLPVMVGTHVEAAVVAEIRPDSVLFEIGGKIYIVDWTNQ